MKQFYSIILTVVYALIIRLVDGLVVEINSLVFIVLTPLIIGIIPFLIPNNDAYFKSEWKILFYPIISLLLFFYIAFSAGLEDRGCLLIIGFPFYLFTIVSGLIFRKTYLKRNDKTSKKLSLIIFLPFLLGPIESKLPKHQDLITISNQITINVNKSKVWNNLLEIPDLTEDIAPNFLTNIGIPKPQYSTYDKAENVRLGYFNNGIVLYEKVKSCLKEKELTFEILMDKSILKNSPTLIHVFENKGVEFESIQYQLEEVDENTTILTLNCEYYLNTNLIYYGKFWSKLILNDFENNLLKGLKHNLENNEN